MLCSHEHRDHNGKEAVTLRQGMNSPFTVRTIDTWHDDQQGTLRGSNLIHILDDGQFTVAHLGDLGCELMQSQIEELEGLDALLIPVGGYYTIDAVQARAVVEKLRPNQCTIAARTLAMMCWRQSMPLLQWRILSCATADLG